MSIPDNFSESLETIFWDENADPDPESCDPGSENRDGKIGSWIWDKHPGSVTLNKIQSNPAGSPALP
jgi:hypothetical protein